MCTASQPRYTQPHGLCLTTNLNHYPIQKHIMAEKARYSDEELEEFKQIILAKLKVAQGDYKQMMNT